jgi:uncharacterized protein YqhQ
MTKNTNENANPEVIMAVGGQAVIEGVMMRSKNRIATAVRRMSGEITLDIKEYRSLVDRYKWLNIPVLRGAITLLEVMILGVKTLNFSADMAMADEEEAKAKEEGRETETKENKGMSNFQAALSVLFAVGAGLLLFFFAPIFLTSQFFNVEQDALAFNLLAGLIRITIFLGYLMAISYMKDVKRLFQYHGAEHKSIYAFEEKASLDIADARQFTTLHPRCGTSFLAMVLVVSILTFSVIDTLYIMYIGPIEGFLTRFLLHLPFVVPVSGIAYEAIKLSAKKASNPLVRFFIAPGLALQKITTKEPDDSQLEVAMVALKAALGDNWEEEVMQKKEAIARLSA